MDTPQTPITRRDALAGGLRGLALIGLGTVGGVLAHRAAAQPLVWQLDPAKCIQCDQCASACVLHTSAVKAVQVYKICGYCDFCPGYFEPQYNALTTAAENHLCPANAILRQFVEEPYYGYSVDESLCVGCAKCVKGCEQFGNGSLVLQVRHDRCVNCNDCAIARACPAQAFRRVPASDAYLLKAREGHA